MASLKDILRTAKEKNLNGIAICDHDEIKGAFKAMELVREFPEKYGGVVVIPGIEVSTAKGHILALGVFEKIPPKMTPEETTDYARDLGALSIIAHPFRKSAHGIGYIEGAGADAVETFNSKSITNGANKKAEKEANRLNMPKTGGSDAHIAELVGQGYTKIDVPDNTADSVISAILQQKTVPGGELTPYSVVARQMGGNVIRRTKLLFKRQFHEV
ncbi:hypothetical protein MsAc7_15320 [Methanolapillus millepedarum]|uniref:PHP domain-containing protein n=2 Tax=Methanolapillus millepedarum TaxID=3028296 RepID=A0AA96V4V0_9EURY|nr:hypothetical protein MsAc7_15320 [Methanosarcinaceae archaeon Ac7]